MLRSWRSRKKCRNRKESILVVCTADSGRIEFRVTQNIVRELYLFGEHRDIYFVTPNTGFLEKFRMALLSKLVIVHSPVFKSLGFVLLARLLRKNVCALVWDKYPVYVNGRRYDQRMLRRLADCLENFLLKLSQRIIIPSADFGSGFGSEKLTEVHFWPMFRIPKGVKLPTEKRLRIVFAGQLNSTRDVGGAVSEIVRLCKLPVKILIASKDQLPEELCDDSSVEFLGSLNSKQLRLVIQSCHFGLVCLSKGFAGPAFPSKTFEYLQAGRPVLYCGPPLPSYVSLLEESGVGVDLQTLYSLDPQLARDLSVGFADKITRFQELSCFNSSNIKLFLKSISLGSNSE